VQKSIESDRPDIFICVVSTHGMEGKVQDLENKSKFHHEQQLFFKDGMVMFTNELVKAFNDTNCPALKDKPRIFFIQVNIVFGFISFAMKYM